MVANIIHEVELEIEIDEYGNGTATTKGIESAVFHQQQKKTIDTTTVSTAVIIATPPAAVADIFFVIDVVVVSAFLSDPEAANRFGCCFRTTRKGTTAAATPAKNC